MLIVDDEELIREILSETFTIYGALVDTAGGGTVAFEKTQTTSYDVIITDLRMPEGDGIKFIESLNKFKIKAVPKVFVCSAYNDLPMEKINELQILKIFVKPFDLNELLSSVHGFLAI